MDKNNDLPSQPVHTNVPNESETQPQQAPARPGETHQQAPSVAYDSNPFSITFTNFSKMFKHAQAVAIIMIIFNILGSFGNVPSFDTSTFDDLQNNDSSLIEQVNSQPAQVTIAQDDAQQSLIDGANLSTGSSAGENNGSSDVNVGAIITIGAIILIAVIAFSLVGLAISAIWSGIVAGSANMAVRDRDISFGEAFSQSMSRFGTMFVALLIAGLKTIGGYLLLIVPGIRAQARYAALPNVVMGNPSMSATQAVNETKKLYDGHLLESFSISWLGGIIPFVGNILSAVGLAQSARQISDYKSKGLQKPPMSGWNWVAPIAITVIFALLGVVMLVVFAAVANMSIK